MIKAVIFDLYNTLAYISPDMYREAKSEMAKLAGVSETIFFEVWRQYSRSINRGDILTVEERVAQVLRDLDTLPNRNIIRRIADIEYSLQEDAVSVSSDTIDLLKVLKSDGYKLGMITNTGYSTSAVTEKLGIKELLDIIVLSFEERALKPSTKIFLNACKQLNIHPHECMFVGDGDDGELEGAFELKMCTVLLQEEKERITHNKSVTSFNYIVSSLSEIKKLLSEQNQ
jgi:putative hydrolase of the HAD superfamily